MRCAARACSAPATAHLVGPTPYLMLELNLCERHWAMVGTQQPDVIEVLVPGPVRVVERVVERVVSRNRTVDNLRTELDAAESVASGLRREVREVRAELASLRAAAAGPAGPSPNGQRPHLPLVAHPGGVARAVACAARCPQAGLAHLHICRLVHGHAGTHRWWWGAERSCSWPAD